MLPLEYTLERLERCCYVSVAVLRATARACPRQPRESRVQHSVAMIAEFVEGFAFIELFG
jgi:hypothetical protein